MKKKILAMLLAAVMIMAMLPTAFAADASGSCGDNLTWSYSDGTLTISGTGAMDDYLEGPPWWDSDLAEKITAVIIPDGVTYIGDNAFYRCSNLTSVTIPSSVTAIGNNAFDYCESLTSVTLPDNVELGIATFRGTPWLQSLGELAVVNGHVYAYRGNDKAVVIPDGVTVIEGGVFMDADLTSVTIPASVTIIGNSAFGLYGPDTGDLTVYYGGSETQWSNIRGVLPVGPGVETASFSEGGMYSAGLEGATVHYNSTGSAEPEDPTEPEVPTSGSCGEDGDNVKWSYSDGTLTISGTGAMADYTPQNLATVLPWEGCKEQVLTVSIGEGVTIINSGAFLGFKNMTSVKIPGSVTAIYDWVFSDCEKLADIYYAGSESQWKQIDIEEAGNDVLNSAKLHTTEPEPTEPEPTEPEPTEPEPTEPEPTEPEPATPAFSDVNEGEYYANAVAWAAEKGYIKGNPDGTFAPNTPMQRVAVFTILARVDGADASGADWDKKAINWAVENNVSYGDNPEDEVTLEQLIVMLWRYTDRPESDISALDRFSDSSSIHTWEDFPEAMAWAVETGILQGNPDGTLKPLSNLERGRGAVILQRYYDNVLSK